MVSVVKIKGLSAGAPPDAEFGSRVDSTEKSVVCLKGFEDDGSNRRIRVVSSRKRPPSADFANGSLTIRLNVPVVRSRSSLSSSDLTN